MRSLFADVGTLFSSQLWFAPDRYDTELTAPEVAGIRQGYLSGFVIGSTNGKTYCFELHLCSSFNELSNLGQDVMQGFSFARLHSEHGMVPIRWRMEHIMVRFFVLCIIRT